MPKRKPRSWAAAAISPSRAAVSPQQLQDRLHAVCLALLTALFVATPLIPSEGVASHGTAAVLVTLWMVLLVIWAVACAAQSKFPLRFGKVEVAVVVLVAIHSASAIVVVATNSGNSRTALNMLWQWVSFGVGYFLVRQLVRTSRQCRALCVVMVGVAVSLSALGYLQYFYQQPRDLQAYQDASEPEKQQMIADAGIGEAPPGSALRRQFEDRLRSKEPLATFALTNSLAGFLAPWLIVTLAMGLVVWSQPALRKRLLLVLICLLAIVFGCLVLTKSRTAWLATVVGIGLTLIYARSRGWKPNWQPLVIGAGVAIGLGLAIVVAGGIDRQVVSEAPKSVLYRLEYWQSTAAVIADHPWFGCGPGNFGDAYTRYKLPQASEEIKDPHNFLLEVWATAGTPALLALLAVFVCFALQVRRAGQRTETDTGDGRATGFTSPGGYFPLYVGAPLGLVLAYPSALGIGHLLNISVLLVGLPVLMSSIALLHPWVERGRLPTSVPIIALAVLLANLLAAGAAGYPGVAQTWWILLAVSLNLAERRSARRTCPRWLALGLVCAALLLAAACYMTVFNPIVVGRDLVSRGTANFDQALAAKQRDQRQSLYRLAEEQLRRATQADPYSEEPWLHLARIYHRSWFESAGDSVFEQFQQAAREALDRDPLSASTHRHFAQLYVIAFQRTGRQQHIEAAIALQRTAVDNYPNSAMERARLAWMYWLAGDRPAASREAEQALRLDEMNPHVEQKLKNRPLFASSSSPVAESTEQLMEKLRKGELHSAPRN